MVDLIQKRLREIQELCAKFDVHQLDLVGSASAGDFKESSDLDFLVVFNESGHLSPADQYFQFRFALEALFQREVDLIELSGIQNRHVRDSVLAQRELLYAA